MARQTLDRNVKFKMLVQDLSLSKPLARGLLELMWDCAHESGNPVFRSAREVEAAAEWDGQGGALAEKLALVGFLDRLDDGGFEIHDYWDHAPEYVVKRREREQERQAKGASLRKRRTTADNGGQRPPISDIDGQRQTSADNGAPPTPTPTPTPITPLHSSGLARARERAAASYFGDRIGFAWQATGAGSLPRVTSEDLATLAAYEAEGVPVEVLESCVLKIAGRQFVAGKRIETFRYFTARGALDEAVTAWREGRSGEVLDPATTEEYRAYRIYMLEHYQEAEPWNKAPPEMVARALLAVRNATTASAIEASLQPLLAEVTRRAEAA